MSNRPTSRRERAYQAYLKGIQYREMMEAAAAYITTQKQKVRVAADAAMVMRPLFKDAAQEMLYAILLDTRNYVICVYQITAGLNDRAQAHAREVFREAIAQNANRLVLVHNHPSGDPMPSGQDVECTRGLATAGRVIGIEVMDHVIIGKQFMREDGSMTKDHVSLRELNLL